MQFSLATLVLAAAAFAHAQSTTSSATGSIPTDLSSISPCIITCITEAKGCASLTDITCFCTNAQFQSDTFGCLQKSCTAADVATVTSLQKSMCGSTSANSTTSTDASSSTATTVETSSTVTTSDASSSTATTEKTNSTSTAPSSTSTGTGTETGTGTGAATPTGSGSNAASALTAGVFGIGMSLVGAVLAL